MEVTERLKGRDVSGHYLIPLNKQKIQGYAITVVLAGLREWLTVIDEGVKYRSLQLVRCKTCDVSHKRYQTNSANWEEKSCDSCFSNLFEQFTFSPSSRAYYKYWYEEFF